MTVALCWAVAINLTKWTIFPSLYEVYDKAIYNIQYIVRVCNIFYMLPSKHTRWTIFSSFLPLFLATALKQKKSCYHNSPPVSLSFTRVPFFLSPSPKFKLFPQRGWSQMVEALLVNSQLKGNQAKRMRKSSLTTSKYKSSKQSRNISRDWLKKERMLRVTEEKC